MELTLVGHQIVGDIADLDAIHHQPEMLWLHVFAAALQTFAHRRCEADGLTFEASLDAFAGSLTKLIHGGHPPDQGDRATLRFSGGSAAAEVWGILASLGWR